jgi:hypothetical protein
MNPRVDRWRRLPLRHLMADLRREDAPDILDRCSRVVRLTLSCPCVFHRIVKPITILACASSRRCGGGPQTSPMGPYTDKGSATCRCLRSRVETHTKQDRSGCTRACDRGIAIGRAPDDWSKAVEGRTAIPGRKTDCQRSKAHGGQRLGCPVGVWKTLDFCGRFPRVLSALTAEARFRQNVWESGTQNACRKTCEFPGRAEAALIGGFSVCPGKRLRFRENGNSDGQARLPRGE